MSKWQRRTDRLVERLTRGDRLLEKFARANLAATENALEEKEPKGKGPDATSSDPAAGVRAVVNIASIHVRSFCERSQQNQMPAYQNCYDLERAKARAGDAIPDHDWRSREIVDHALFSLHDKAMNDVYFAAAELSGAGIRFYGDICLVLKSDEVTSETIVLDRNSYDVLRAPFRDAVEKVEPESQQAARRFILEALSGEAGFDLKTIGALKVLTTTGERDRRLSTGQIASALLDDEDYIEILKIGSFDTEGLEAARISAAEAALENYVERHLRNYPSSHATHIWLMQRKDATNALRAAGIDVVVIASHGRIKS